MSSVTLAVAVADLADLGEPDVVFSILYAFLYYGHCILKLGELLLLFIY